MAEYLDDFHNVDEVFEFDSRPYLFEPEYTDIQISQRNFPLSGTYNNNNNLSLSVAKTSTFSERNITLTLLTCPCSLFRDYRLQRYPSILDQFKKNCCSYQSLRHKNIGK